MLRGLLQRLRPVPARLYTRVGCGLCDELEEQLRTQGLAPRLALERVDVDQDRRLKKAYGLRLPVLEIADRVVAEGRPDPRTLREEVLAALRGARA